MATSRKGTYVYCVVAAPRRPTLRRALRGLPGMGSVRLLDVDRGMWLVVADAPLDRYGEDAINRDYRISIGCRGRLWPMRPWSNHSSAGGPYSL